MTIVYWYVYIFVILLLIIVVIALTLETPCDILWLGLFHQSTLCELLPSLESNSIVPSKNSTRKGNQRLFLPQRKGFNFLYIRDHMGISKSVAVLWLRLAMQQRAEEDYHLGQAKEVPTGDVQVLVGRLWRTPGDLDCDIVCITSRFHVSGHVWTTAGFFPWTAWKGMTLKGWILGYTWNHCVFRSILGHTTVVNTKEIAVCWNPSGSGAKSWAKLLNGLWPWTMGLQQYCPV